MDPEKSDSYDEINTLLHQRKMEGDEETSLIKTFDFDRKKVLKCFTYPHTSRNLSHEQGRITAFECMFLLRPKDLGLTHPTPTARCHDAIPWKKNERRHRSQCTILVYTATCTGGPGVCGGLIQSFLLASLFARQTDDETETDRHIFTHVQYLAKQRFEKHRVWCCDIHHL